jgi:ubiquinone/menaquinone biosynthesis C-methylase UbiE
MSLEHWESYYRLGHLATSLMGGSEPGYTQEIRDAWLAFFADVPDGGRIVDLGTGNGAVALIAKQAATQLGRSFDIHGIDLAQIDPARHVKDGARLFEGVQFHALTRADQLPFESGSIAAVAGQYSLEFMDTAPVLADVYRVLCGGRRAQFIIHDSDSILVANGRVSLKQAELILEDTHVLRLLKRFCEVERKAPANARKHGVELTTASNRMRSEGARIAQGSFLLEMTNRAMAQIFELRTRRSLEATLLAIDQLEKELRTTVRRLRETEMAARSEPEMAELVMLAGRVGFQDVECGPQLHGGMNRIGWRLTLRKPG